MMSENVGKINKCVCVYVFYDSGKYWETLEVLIRFEDTVLDKATKLQKSTNGGSNGWVDPPSRGEMT